MDLPFFEANDFDEVFDPFQSMVNSLNARGAKLPNLASSDRERLYQLLRRFAPMRIHPVIYILWNAVNRYLIGNYQEPVDLVPLIMDGTIESLLSRYYTPSAMSLLLDMIDEIYQSPDFIPYYMTRAGGSAKYMDDFYQYLDERGSSSDSDSDSDSDSGSEPKRGSSEDTGAQRGSSESPDLDEDSDSE